MSARFFKILSCVFVAHLVVLSAVWVGFSAPFPRPPAAFIFEGALPVQDTGGTAADEWPKGKTPDQFTLDLFDASYYNHWIELRDPSRDLVHDHLGL